MGIIASLFHKEQNYSKILEEIDQQIKKTELRLQNYDVKHRTYVLRLIIFGILLEFVYFIYWKYFVVIYQPIQRLLFVLPFAVIALIIFLLRKLVIMYYQHRTNVDRVLLSELELQKEEKLEEYLKKINFQEVENLVTKYSKRRTSAIFGMPSSLGTPSRPIMNFPPSQFPSSATSTPLRRVQDQQPIGTMNNNIPQSPSSSQLPPPPPPPSSSIPSTPIHHSSSSPPPSPTPTPTPTNPKTPRLLTIPVSQTTQYSSLSSPAGDISQQQQQQQHHSEEKKSLIERLISFLVGDSPSHSFVLICAKCKTDNGRVIAHEKEEIPFSCSKCGHLNIFNKRRQESSENRSEKKDTTKTNTNNTSNKPEEKDLVEDSSTVSSLRSEQEETKKNV